ncbi:MAG: hypothetical protein WAV95_11095 [Azonexus sp.]
MKIRYLTALGVPVLLACCASALAGDAQALCATPPFLSKYDAAGLLRPLPGGKIALELVADLHSADCGAPDCYGTKLGIVMTMRRQGAACVVGDIRVRSTDFYGKGCENPDRAGHSRLESYVTEGGRIDIANPQRKSLTLRSKNGRRAIVLLADNFFYFTEVKPGGVLHTRLPGDDDEDSCCWGSSSANGNFGPDR